MLRRGRKVRCGRSDNLLCPLCTTRSLEVCDESKGMVLLRPDEVCKVIKYLQGCCVGVVMLLLARRPDNQRTWIIMFEQRINLRPQLHVIAAGGVKVVGQLLTGEFAGRQEYLADFSVSVGHLVLVRIDGA